MKTLKTNTFKSLLALLVIGGPVSGCDIEKLVDSVTDSETETIEEEDDPSINLGGTEEVTPVEPNSDCPADTYCSIESDDQAEEAVGALWSHLSSPDCWRADGGEGLIQITFAGQGEYEFIYASDPSSGSAEMHEGGDMQMQDIGTYNGILTGVVQTFTAEAEYLLLESETTMLHSIVLEGETYNLPYEATNDCY